MRASGGGGGYGDSEDSLRPGCAGCALGGLKFPGSSGVNFLLILLRLRLLGALCVTAQGGRWVPEPGRARGGTRGVCLSVCHPPGDWHRKGSAVLSKDRARFTALLPLKLRGVGTPAQELVAGDRDSPAPEHRDASPGISAPGKTGCGFQPGISFNSSPPAPACLSANLPLSAFLQVSWEVQCLMVLGFEVVAVPEVQPPR